jgi:hypothetical protein
LLCFHRRTKCDRALAVTKLNALLQNGKSQVNELVSEKVLHFTGKNKDLTQLSQQIVSQLNSEGYKTQTATPPLGIVIQAKKAGILRGIITADRAFSIMITGQPNDFSIHVGIGKWIQNIAVAAAEAILLSWLRALANMETHVCSLHCNITSDVNKKKGGGRHRANCRTHFTAASHGHKTWMESSQFRCRKG